MSAASIVLESLKAGVHLFSDGNKLGFKLVNGHFPDELKSKIISNKAQILEYLKQCDANDSSSFPMGEINKRAANNGDVFPASFAQKRLYFINQLSAGNEYNSIDLFRIKGDFDLAHCELAFVRLIERHLPLRTVYFEDEFGVQQRVLNSVSFKLEKANIKSDELAAERSEIQQAAQELLNIAFDLKADLPIRVKVLVRSNSEHILLLSQHHIATDGWSNKILLQEWQQVYQQICAGEKSHLPPLDIDYIDYTLWQKALFDDGKAAKQIEYWRAHLSGMPTLHKVATDHPRPKSPTHAGANHSFRLESKEYQQLQALAKKYNVTTFMLLHAVFSVLLYRVSAHDDIVIGTPVANRRNRSLEGLIGLFVNTLVLRLRCEADMCFNDFLSETKRVILDALANQDVPFEHLVEIINPPRSLSYSPLVQIVFTLSQAELAQQSAGPLTVEPIKPECSRAKFDLNLNAIEYRDAIEFNFQYSTELFSAASIESLSSQFVTLIDSICIEPTTPLSQLNLLPGGTEQALLKSVVSRYQNYPAVDCLDNIFSRTAAQFPQRIALSCGAVDLTYKELDEKSNQLAHYLVSQGISHNDKVGICLPRSHNTLVAILAILKVGAIYVPLDPANPESRLSYIAVDSQVSSVITSADTPNLNLFDHNMLICIGSLALEELPVTKPNIEAKRAVSDPAYIIYTSGSTGKPKGVVVSHGNVERLFYSVEDKFDFTERDVWTMFHSYAFDFSVWEMWGAFFYGGKLVVVDEQQSRDPETFYELVALHKVTVLSQTPSAFIGFDTIDREQAQNLSLRYVIFGGEALQLSSLKGWYTRHPDDYPAIVNMYGTTETTVHATYRKLEKQDVEQNRGSLIGESLSDLTIYILDTAGKLVPNGVAGEMYIGGAGVSYGYYNKAELTSERFISNPYLDGDILYKTGDGARVLSDGEIEYLGRLDNQVQVRGFRVELSEIERKILELPSITSAIVIYQQEEKSLVAYIVSEVNKRINEATYIANLKAELAVDLPKYMIPNRFVVLDKLPTTVNGKIDKNALPNVTSALSDKVIVEPRNHIEEELVGIWSKVLKIEQICIYDNYFTLGGDSIKVLSLIAAAKNRGVFFSVQDLYNNQTVEKLATFIADTRKDTRCDSASVPDTKPAQHYLANLSGLEKSSVEDAFPTTVMQQIMLKHHGLHESVVGVYLPQTVFEIRRSHFSITDFRDAIETLIGQIPALRSTFVKCSEYGYIQLVHRRFNVNFDIEDISGLAAHEQKIRAEELRNLQLSKPFEINDSSNSLIRFVVIRYNESHHEVIVSSHHAIEDGWGMVIFFNELMKNYGELVAKVHPQPSVLANNSFKEHVYLEQEAINSKEKRHFWLDKLASFDTHKQLNLKPRGDREGLDKVEVAFKGHDVKTLVNVAAAHKAQAKTLFLQCFIKSLVAKFHTQQLSIDMLTSGRSEHLSNPLNSMGLFWSFCPFFYNSERNSEQQLEQLQIELNDITTHAIFPYQHALADEAETIQSQISFKFVQFHHAKDHEGAQTIAAEDRFHYPLNLSVGLSNCEQLSKLELTFNQAYITQELAKDILKAMEKELKKIIKEYK
ncbi:non-ribosomal peptide synthetase [Pseudoalteromonas rubra]|uniref:Carrier domain-containing protein n=1 Tax=Pseudoalteromonas rubra TaxID=43658 RepID=A0A0F4QG75_9GAMM|nr:non-ribosomal peptide synthetase [Pseudoalteromonas rubra]KJZ06718.1 hypothetical protein TW77_18095 [Pseudoalteromonas rubra]